MPDASSKVAILHLDGDSFFASVEAAKDPSLRGKPIVTGRERGIASALSAEAKALGINRATPIFKIRKEFPQVIVVDSDYDAYAMYCQRMMNIVRRHVIDVEEYSIDECFATIPLRCLGPEGEVIMRRIQTEIWTELGITVSLGLATTKVLAKVASKTRKPRGITVLTPDTREDFIKDLPVGKVWGIGTATAIFLGKRGIRTAFDFASKDRVWVEKECDKPLRQLWYELRGVSVMALNTTHDDKQSIRRTRSFVPATNDVAYIFSELSHNAEGACARVRERGLYARHVSIFLKRADFTYVRADSVLPLSTCIPTTLLSHIRLLFARIYEPGIRYRATGVILSGIVRAGEETGDLFGAQDTEKNKSELFKVIDKLGRRFGDHTVFIASSSSALSRERKEEGRLREKRGYFPGERIFGRPLCIPFLGDVS